MGSDAMKGLQSALVTERRKRQAAEMEAWIRKAYAGYRARRTIEADILSSTKAGFSGGHYKLELLPDGGSRVLWSGNVGNLYDSPGQMISIPQLGEDEYDAEDDGNHFFDNAIEAMDAAIEDVVSEQRHFILNT